MHSAEANARFCVLSSEPPAKSFLERFVFSRPPQFALSACSLSNTLWPRLLRLRAKEGEIGKGGGWKERNEKEDKRVAWTKGIATRWRPLLETRMLLGAPGLTTRSKNATRNKDATSSQDSNAESSINLLDFR